ncbi:sulfite exporter TauE/SafE family protein [Sulfurimonas marina]|uniref:Probable membrane transporter protein n=1 Tax=Sulfurimonas marina TaxID=2590551 RepID=A0A7M1AUX7_9BACT|nr:sulfite exporter TauE/SafE family protein [Sulfurimonas marina]QOP41220.1 sulfite exporter TauE/SafE family protein [Sulfurimonas marina]
MKRFLQGFSAGGAVATLAGLIGLGGAEFRLPILKGLFQLDTLKAVILNKATSLVVVFFALFFRSYEVPLEQIWEYKTIIINLLAGSLVGAWIAAGYAMKIDEKILDRIIFIILLLLAAVLLFEHWFLSDQQEALFHSIFLEILAGIFAGFIIGIVASLLGVAGGELLIPTIVILYGIDVKLAGSLSLAISLPTMIVGFIRYSKSQAFVILKEEKKLFLSLSIGSIVGAAIGSALLGFIASDILIVLLALILILSAYKIFHHQNHQ